MKISKKSKTRIGEKSAENLQNAKIGKIKNEKLKTMLKNQTMKK